MNHSTIKRYFAFALTSTEVFPNGTLYKLHTLGASFDGNGLFTEMEAYLDEKGVFNIIGDKMRAKLYVSDDNTMIAHWENSKDNKSWSTWMDLNLSK